MDIRSNKSLLRILKLVDVHPLIAKRNDPIEVSGVVGAMVELW